jgi:hypothetical protein
MRSLAVGCVHVCARQSLLAKKNCVYEAFSCHLAAAYSPLGVRAPCSLDIKRHRVVVLRGDFTSPVPLALASLKPIALQSFSVPVCVMQIARKLVHVDNLPAVHGHAVHCSASHLQVTTFLANFLLSFLVICGRSHIYVEFVSTILRLDNRFVHSQRAFSCSFPFEVLVDKRNIFTCCT